MPLKGMVRVVIALSVLAVLLLVAVVGLIVQVTQNRGIRRRLEDVLGQASDREKNAVAKSRIGHVAKITEQFAPLLPGFPDYNVKDVRWVGGEVDMIVWDGLEDGRDVTVVLLDVKTGRASANARQRRIRNAVEAGRVRFKIVSFRPEQAAAVSERTDIPPGIAVTKEELDAELIKGEDDPGWEKHIGNHVVSADDPPDK
ncbi:MAG TPA: Holliday junction resolvase-like protein [Streptosporangiaceae bacterium]|jgi:predicted Holliday junction resolvase-like endonuclease